MPGIGDGYIGYVGGHDMLGIGDGYIGDVGGHDMLGIGSVTSPFC